MVLSLDFHSETPIYTQIHDQIILGIAQGRLLPGERLPTIRALADQCGINMMTASKAYQLLAAEGHIQTGRRSGAVVCVPAGTGDLTREQRQALRLLASQARLAGLSQQQFLQFCAEAYASPKEASP